jgi:uncharacterized membrane protein YqaE (UPF0057 family)
MIIAVRALQFLQRLSQKLQGKSSSIIALGSIRHGMALALQNVMDLIRIVLSILLPPVGVFLQVGFGLHFWINILLTLLGYIPGIVHAVWIIARR